MLILEGIIQMYCRYASEKKKTLLSLRFALYGENPEDDEADFGRLQLRRR